MFTGIVQAVGRVRRFDRQADTATLAIATPLTATSAIGDSIAVNGVCLTITACDTAGFETTMMPETMRRTNLGELSERSLVDLELALAATARLDGHFVLGHVDITTQLVSRQADQNAVVLRLALPKDGERLIVDKGSIAIDGISLTVTTVDATSFGVSLIPHTLAQTVLGQVAVGGTVNLEYDVLGKYVVNLMEVKHESN